jgi:hypothetical protein
MEPLRPVGPRPDLDPVRPVVLSPREREQRRGEREQRRREREERERDDGTPPRLDIRA